MISKIANTRASQGGVARAFLSLIPLSIIICLFAAATAMQPQYLSPTRMAVHPLTGEIYVLLSTAASLAKVDPATEKVTGIYSLGFTPSDICFSKAGDSTLLYAAEFTANGKLHILSPANCEKNASIDTGAFPSAIVVNKQGTRAYVANRFSNDLSIIDLVARREIKCLPMLREPRSLALSPDGKFLAVGNYFPLQSAQDDLVSACVTLVDTGHDAVVAHIPLANGTQSIEDVRFSKDGALLFATHILSRFHLPTTQVERGWMNTNAVSLIDVAGRKYYTTLLLDDVYLGAANPCGMTLSDDGGTLFVAASGAHELIAISLPPVLARIKREPRPEDIANNLTFLAGDKTRISLRGKGPRYVLMQGGKLFVTNYFSGNLTVVDAGSPSNKRFIKLGDEPEPDRIRKGELYFADASLCFQKWQSCVTCHPGARADGLNWDLFNDGIGNPKNTKSMLYAHATPPSMITGIRASAEVAVRAGIRHIQFAEPSEETAACIDEYLKSLRPVPSPRLVDGKLSPLASRGEKLFAQAQCNSCHNGPYLTDGKKYDVGTGVEESAGVHFDTPTLREVWRTAPYLYHGGAVAIRDVLIKYNKDDKHGATSKLTDEEIEALAEYILSL